MSDPIRGPELRGLVRGLDETLVGMTRESVLECHRLGGGYPCPAPILGDWYEERSHMEPATLARLGWPVSALRDYIIERTGRRPAFVELYKAVSPSSSRPEPSP